MFRPIERPKIKIGTKMCETAKTNTIQLSRCQTTLLIAHTIILRPLSYSNYTPIISVKCSQIYVLSNRMAKNENWDQNVQNGPTKYSQIIKMQKNTLYCPYNYSETTFI